MIIFEFGNKLIGLFMVRDIYLNRLVNDLQGPYEKDEEIFGEFPSERYLIGSLHPLGSGMGDDQNDLFGGDSDGAEESSDNSSVSAHRQFKQGTIGLSFRASPNADIRVVIS